MPEKVISLNELKVALEYWRNWTDPMPVDKFSLHNEACSEASGLMPPSLVVEHFNVIEDIRLDQIPGFIYPLPDPFFF